MSSIRSKKTRGGPHFGEVSAEDGKERMEEMEKLEEEVKDEKERKEGNTERWNQIIKEDGSSHEFFSSIAEVPEVSQKSKQHKTSKTKQNTRTMGKFKISTVAALTQRFKHLL